MNTLPDYYLEERLAAARARHRSRLRALLALLTLGLLAGYRHA